MSAKFVINKNNKKMSSTTSLPSRASSRCLLMILVFSIISLSLAARLEVVSHAGLATQPAQQHPQAEIDSQHPFVAQHPPPPSHISGESQTSASKEASQAQHQAEAQLRDGSPPGASQRLKTEKEEVSRRLRVGTGSESHIISTHHQQQNVTDAQLLHFMERLIREYVYNVYYSSGPSSGPPPDEDHRREALSMQADTSTGSQDKWSPLPDLNIHLADPSVPITIANGQARLIISLDRVLLFGAGAALLAVGLLGLFMAAMCCKFFTQYKRLNGVHHAHDCKTHYITRCASRDTSSASCYCSSSGPSPNGCVISHPPPAPAPELKVGSSQSVTESERDINHNTLPTPPPTNGRACMKADRRQQHYTALVCDENDDSQPPARHVVVMQPEGDHHQARSAVGDDYRPLLKTG